MQKKLLAIILIFLGLALLQPISGYLTNQLKAIPDFPDKDKWVVGAVVVAALLFCLFSVAAWLLPAEQGTKPTELSADRRKLLLKTELEKMEKRLMDSLEQRVLIDVQREEQPEQVDRRLRSWLAAERELRIRGQKAETLAPQERIIDVFRRSDIGGRLLILGAPGSGKTITILDLARELLDVARQDAEEPMPFLFELSSWREQPILDWLTVELKEEYNFDPKISKPLIEAGKILPLLDGLDELGMARQTKCVEALNRYLADDATRDLVVCCRQEEYEQGAVKLSELHGAVGLLPLTDTQIQGYLTQLSKADLWREITSNPELSRLLQPDIDGNPRLLRTPLFLSVAAAAYTGQVIRNQGDLWDAYLDKQLNLPFRDLPRQVYTPQQAPSRRQTRYYLIFLSRQLNRTKTEFLIERMQPTWLWTTAQWWSYLSAFALVFVMVGWPVYGLAQGMVGWPVFVLSFLLFGDPTKIQPVETLQFSITRAARREIVQRLVRWLLGLLVCGLILGLLGGLVYGLVYALAFGLVYGLVFCPVCGLVFGLLGGLVSLFGHFKQMKR